MAKIKYDIRNIEATVFEQPTPGLYPAKVESMEEGESKAGNAQLIIQFRISSGQFKNALLWYYVPLDPEAAGAFRMVELIKALKLKDAGTFDTAKEVGKSVQVRTKDEMYLEERKARIANVIPAGDDDDEDLDEDDDDVEDDPEPEPKAKRRTRRKAPEPEPDEDEDDEDDEDDDEEPEPPKRTRRKAAAKPEPEPEPEEDDEDGDDEEDDYKTWEVGELKNELKERGLRSAGNKTALIQRLREDDESDDPFS